jgi:hypothetical protein
MGIQRDPSVICLVVFVVVLVMNLEILVILLELLEVFLLQAFLEVMHLHLDL